ncbi:MAG TPA: hypothetical protein VK932_30340, partial [Kofleriaceae bacterium]|nr:hypothetical protein [Kofleriaceae bacterium]
TVETTAKDPAVARDERRTERKPIADRGGAGGDKFDADDDGELARRPTKQGDKKKEPARKPADARPGTVVVRQGPAPAPKPAPAPPPPPPAAPAEEAPEADRGLEDEEEQHAVSGAVSRSAMALDEGDSLSGEMIEITAVGGRRGLRISAGLGGGLTRAGGDGSPLIALSTRIELGRRTLLGAGASLWLVGAGERGLDVQGQVLATFARHGLLARWLEVGGGLGLQLGAGVGPAASASLRLHLPPSPRAAAYLKYDGALLYEEGARAGQSAFTLGLEYGF